MARSPSLPQQLPLPLEPQADRPWGGARKGAGRKPGPRPGVLHRARPAHRAEHPVLVTLRARPNVAPLRSNRVFAALRDAIRTAGDTDSGRATRVVHFSVQSDHVHLLVESSDTSSLSRGLRGLAIRMALAVNRARKTSGPVWAGRYHARALKTPRQVRNALVYVLMNCRKHEGGPWGHIDSRSSGPWFDGFRLQPSPPPAGVDSPVAPPTTWLLRVGWRRHGLIDIDEAPKGAWGGP